MKLVVVVEVLRKLNKFWACDKPVLIDENRCFDFSTTPVLKNKML